MSSVHSYLSVRRQIFLHPTAVTEDEVCSSYSLNNVCVGFLKVAMCVRTKDIGRYVPEWVAYHWALGVDEFMIYDDDSVDDTREVSLTALPLPTSPRYPLEGDTSEGNG